MESIRTTESVVTFRHPFNLPSVSATQPAGTYRLVIDEAKIDGLSFSAYRRIATMLHLPAIGINAAKQQVYVIEPRELEAAMTADATETEPMESCR